MSIRSLLCAAVMVLVATAPWVRASESLIAPALAEAMQHGAGPHRVIVFFKDARPVAENLARADRIRAMQANAEASRRSFLTLFGADVTDVRSYWLINAVAMVARQGTIESMVLYDGIRRIELDDVVELLPTRVERDGTEASGFAWGLEKIGVPEARTQFGLLGTGVRVGIIDTGCDGKHPDLQGKVVAFKDFVDGKTETYDDQGHGTHCCGTIAGGNAGGTHIGVAPEARLVVAKSLNAQGSGYDSWLLGAMEFMADPDGDPATADAPVVVNNSWGSSGNDTTFVDAVKAWLALGIVPAFAAGNSGPFGRTVGIPGGYLESFAVGSTSSWDWASVFSSRGPVTWDGVDHVKPDVAAPGSSIYSAKAGGGYTKLSGTSMACPHVTGVIALMFQARPGLTVAQVRPALESTAKDLGDDGKDNTYGAGRIQVPQVLQTLKAARARR